MLKKIDLTIAICERKIHMNSNSRLEAFEKMLSAVQNGYETANEKMIKLKAEGKEKTVTFRQHMGDKMLYKSMLSMYKIYGLTDDNEA